MGRVMGRVGLRGERGRNGVNIVLMYEILKKVIKEKKEQ